MTCAYRGCGLETVDVMDLVRQDEFLYSKRSCVLPVEGQVLRNTANNKSHTTAYGSRRMGLTEWGKPVVLCVHTVMNMLYIQDRGWQANLLMLERVRCDWDEGRMIAPAMP